MQKIGATRNQMHPNSYTFDGMRRGKPYHMRLNHFQGDAVSQADLADVLKSDEFDVAIVLSTQVRPDVLVLCKGSEEEQ